MSVSSTSSTATSVTAASSSANVTATGYDAFNDLGVEAFLELMTTELQNQDPLNPMDNAEMLSQVSQIREIMSNDSLTNTLEDMTGTFESVILGQNMATASGMIGQTVEAEDNSGVDFTGEVTRVSIVGGVPTLTCTEVIEEYVDEETGETIPKQTIEHTVSLENISSIVPAGTEVSAGTLSQQISAASAMIGKTVVAKQGEEIVSVTDDEGNTTEERQDVETSVAGIVEKTLVEDGKAKVQILIPAGEATTENPDPKDRRIIVTLSDIEQVLPEEEQVDPSKLTEDLAVAATMIGRIVSGNATDKDGNSCTLSGWVDQVYVEDGSATLAVQPESDPSNLYALALDKVTNVGNYSDPYPIPTDGTSDGGGSTTTTEGGETTTTGDAT